MKGGRPRRGLLELKNLRRHGRGRRGGVGYNDFVASRYLSTGGRKDRELKEEGTREGGRTRSKEKNSK